MQEYLDVFARFKRNEHVQAVANVLETRSELDKFEKAQLGKTLIMLTFVRVTRKSVLMHFGLLQARCVARPRRKPER